VEAVERHRANEGGFRFETSAQLKEVEDERIRLEKERRVRAVRLRPERVGEHFRNMMVRNRCALQRNN